nr:replication protein A 70 kDa DNA-binding subunit B-like isoform X1 [Ipomoea batatas]
MVRKLLISDVSPGEKDWSCKVCVVKKLDAQDSKTTPGNKYRPIILQDEDKLEVMEDPEIDEISFSHFHKYINTMKKISVMAIVIHKLPRKHVDSKNGKIDAADFVLVDKQAKPVIFTLWGKYSKVEGVELEKQLTIGNFPVILAKNVEVTNYSELLSVSASKLVDMDKKNETIDMQNVKEKLDNKTFKVELLCKKQNFRGTEQVRYSIISLQEQKKIAHAKRVKRKLIYDDTDDNTSDEHSKAFGDFDNEVTDKKSKLVKLG